MDNFQIGTIRENINLLYHNLHLVQDTIPKKFGHLLDLAGRWNINTNGDIVPEDNARLSIGSAQKTVKSLFLSQNSLHIVKQTDTNNFVSVKFGVSEDNSLAITQDTLRDTEQDGNLETVDVNPLTVPAKTQLLFSETDNTILINAVKTVSNTQGNSTNVINATNNGITASTSGTYISPITKYTETNLIGNNNLLPMYYDEDTKEVLSSDGSGHFTNLNVSGIIKGPEELIIDPSPINDNTGAVKIKGNLIVEGTQTLINANVVSIKGSAQGSFGIEIKDEENVLANFLYDGTDDKWKTNNKDLDIGTGKITVGEIVSKSFGNILYTQTISSGATEDIYLSNILVDTEDLQVGIFSVSIIDSSGQSGSVGVYLMTKIFNNFFYTVLIEKNIGYSELSFDSETGILRVMGDSSSNVSLEIKILNITKRDTI